MSIEADETSLFRTAWSLYDTITAHNYMYHREIYGVVGQLLRECHERSRYSMLDLGCGNARFLAPCLKAHPPARYSGVDLSATALDEARTHLEGIQEVTLSEQDMLQAVQNIPFTFDLIFSGFAVHHLDAIEKQQLFHACAGKLAHGGRVILVDVVREEHQSREQYLDGYLRMMRTGWTAVPAEQLEEACTHVAAHDFPETLSGLEHMASAAGLTQTRLLARFGQHHVIAFSN